MKYNSYWQLMDFFARNYNHLWTNAFFISPIELLCFHIKWEIMLSIRHISVNMPIDWLGLIETENSNEIHCLIQQQKRIRYSTTTTTIYSWNKNICLLQSLESLQWEKKFSNCFIRQSGVESTIKWMTNLIDFDRLQYKNESKNLDQNALPIILIENCKLYTSQVTTASWVRGEIRKRTKAQWNR